MGLAIRLFWSRKWAWYILVLGVALADGGFELAGGAGMPLQGAQRAHFPFLLRTALLVFEWPPYVFPQPLFPEASNVHLSTPPAAPSGTCFTGNTNAAGNLALKACGKLSIYFSLMTMRRRPLPIEERRVIRVGVARVIFFPREIRR